MADASSPPLFQVFAFTKQTHRRDAALRNLPGLTSRAVIRAAPACRPRVAEALGVEAVRRIERLIGDGTLAPGERLNEVVLSRSPGVSRGPVREAVRALEKTGLVTIILNHGAFVLSLADAQEIYEINGALFGLASGRAASTLPSSRTVDLQDGADAIDTAIAKNHRKGFFRMDSRFHTFIMARGRNREAQSLYGQMTRMQPRHMQDANREHHGPMQAILAGHGGRVRKLPRCTPASARHVSWRRSGAGPAQLQARRMHHDPVGPDRR